MTTQLRARINNISQPRVATISYGGRYALKQASDLNFPSFANGDIVAYQANTQTFVAESPGDFLNTIESLINLDAGFF